MSRRTHPISAPTRDALAILGSQIAMARRARRWKATELAERAGISVTTLRKLERGEGTVAIGVAFEIATLLDLSLFGVPAGSLGELRAREMDRLALLPHRVYDKAEAPDDNF